MSEDLKAKVLKKLATFNGEVNKMSKKQLLKMVKEKDLNPSGTNLVLKRRLKNHQRKTKLLEKGLNWQCSTSADFVLVIDFEATCQENTHGNYKHEIIEFPIVLIDVALLSVVDEFHEYVQPSINHVLSDFCVKLTGISQEKVDGASRFPAVLGRVTEWLGKHGLLEPTANFVVVTDGPWDMSRFLFQQCILSGVEFPGWARSWANIRRIFCSFYGVKRTRLAFMLDELQLEFEGRQHSGIDDARNIARICVQLVDDGAPVVANERLKCSVDGRAVIESVVHTSDGGVTVGTTRLTASCKPGRDAHRDGDPSFDRRDISELLYLAKIQGISG